MTALDTTRLHTPTKADRHAGDWIVINGEMCKWSQIDPERWELHQRNRAALVALDAEYKRRRSVLVDQESALIEETRKRYPGK